MALFWYAPLPHNSPHIYLLNILTTETHVLSSLLRLSVVAILVLSNIVQINSETLEENAIKMSSKFKKIWKLRFVDFYTTILAYILVVYCYITTQYHAIPIVAHFWIFGHFLTWIFPTPSKKLKLRFSKKAKKIEKISHLFWQLNSNLKTSGRLFFKFCGLLRMS